MGVSGAGKTTVGQRLAKFLGWSFEEGDRLHPPENVEKMRGGRPLTDSDREPWLAAIAEVIDGWRKLGQNGVITCSALKRAYRRRIIGDRCGVRLVYLDGPRELVAGRLASRQDHFMPTSLLDSQFAALEPPGADERPITVRIDQPVEDIVGSVASMLASRETASIMRGTP
jgi:carbohydrate kinase (thermoresistant glucokinase family)